MVRAFAFVSVVGLFGLGLMGACTLGNATSTTSGTGGTAATCTQTEGCAACLQCAETGPCASIYDACQGDENCSEVYACYASCESADDTCKQDCETGNPDGATSAEAVISCELCDQCPTACTGQCTTSE